ncbi:MAG: hypothetical protein OXD01_04700, partial [Gammaproteobacteria bacterium]|nr:hypothetical protein [Gammaproteobacteria bacterium]
GGICAVAKKGLIPINLCSISHFRNTISHNLVSVSHLKIIFGHFGLGWNFIKNKEYAEKQAIMTIFWGKVFLRMPFGPYKSRVSEQRNCLGYSGPASENAHYSRPLFLCIVFSIVKINHC